jgi:Rad3-related DNA helicase
MLSTHQPIHSHTHSTKQHMKKHCYSFQNASASISTDIGWAVHELVLDEVGLKVELRSNLLHQLIELHIICVNGLQHSSER